MKNEDLLPWFIGGGVVVGAIAMLTDTGQNAVNYVKATAQTALTTRTPQDILDAVAKIDPEHNPDLQPGANGGADWCNRFLYLVLKELGVYMPINTLANAEIEFMASSSDWTQLSQDDALAAALQGQVVVATYYNPGGHGHVALVLPIDGPMQIAQAGASTFNRGTLAHGFGSLPVAFYAHA